MITSRLALLSAFALVASGCAASGAGTSGGPILADDFNRGDAEEVGGGWTSVGLEKAGIADNAVIFPLGDSFFEPRLCRKFAPQKSGRIRVSFKMDWVRGDEANWGFFMQLGDSSAMTEKLDLESDLPKGVAVNLLWGGGEHVDEDEDGAFGPVKDGTFTKLVAVNDSEYAETMMADPVVTLDLDLEAGTYAVTINGKTYPNQPFAHKGAIDTIRFVAHGCSDTGFDKHSIDDVTITRVK